MTLIKLFQLLKHHTNPKYCKTFILANVLILHVNLREHSCIHRQKIAPMELAQLGNKSQKISSSFQLLSSLSVNCENNKSDSLQMSHIRFPQVFFFFFFLSLGPFCVRKCHIWSLWVLIYMGTHNWGYSKFGSTLKFF